MLYLVIIADNSTTRFLTVLSQVYSTMAEARPTQSSSGQRIAIAGAYNMEELEATLKEMEKLGKSLAIFTVGKCGVGKSSLIRDLLGPNAKKSPVVKGGMLPGTMTENEYVIPVGDGVSVNVYDTRGTFDGCGGHHEEKTASLVGKVCQNDLNGVLLVCIEMHSRLDEGAIKTIALLHQQFGMEIWRFAVIVLTKADDYPKDEWLKSKKFYQRKDPILKREFEKNLQKCKKSLQEIFTSPETDSQCYIGISQQQYDDLNIPILPTSTLNPKAIKKMEGVGYESWFDMLLLECCKQEQGAALVKIHSQRLANLSRDILDKLNPKNILGAEFDVLIRSIVQSQFGKTALVLAWKLYWLKYSHRVITAPRFENQEQEQ